MKKEIADKHDFYFNKVMLIDDTEIDRYVTAFTMKKNNFAREIMEFGIAGEAIEFLEENLHHPDALPEIILLDIRMPEIDGFQFLETLSAFQKDLKQHVAVFLLSSSLDTEDFKLAEQFEIVKKFINKPFDRSRLEEIVEAMS